jgi:hypothetical protein
MRAWQKKLWQLMGVRSKDAFKRIIERMEAIMKMEVEGTEHEARMVEVNAVMDTTLKQWETSKHQSEKKAADYFKYWRKKTGETLECSSQHRALLQALFLTCSYAGLLCCTQLSRLLQICATLCIISVFGTLHNSMQQKTPVTKAPAS